MFGGCAAATRLMTAGEPVGLPMVGSAETPPSAAGSDHSPPPLTRAVSALTRVGAMPFVTLVSNVDTTPSTSFGLPNANAEAFAAWAGMSIVA